MEIDCPVCGRLIKNMKDWGGIEYCEFCNTKLRIRVNYDWETDGGSIEIDVLEEATKNGN